MRKLYLFLTVILSLTATIAVMGASVNLFEHYERSSWGGTEKVQAVAGKVVEKRVVREEHRLYIELRNGPRAGEIVQEAATPAQYAALMPGADVTVLLGPGDRQRLSRAGQPAVSTALLLAIAILAVLGCAALVYRIRRMPAGSAGDPPRG